MLDALFARFNRTLAAEPERPAFQIQRGRSAWQRVTYREFAGHIALFARGLAGLRLQPGERAVLMVPPGLDLFALVLAMLQRGVAPVMVDPAIGLSNVTACLAECQPQVYIGSPLTHAIRRLYGWGHASLRRNLSLADIVRAGRDAPPAPALARGPQDEALVIFTSGSTGLPKGAVYSLANLAAQIEILVEELGLRGDEIDLPAFPLFALIDCLLGVTAVIPDPRFPSPGRVDPARMAAAILAQGVETLFVSPAALARLARHCAARGLRLPGLKKVFTAGAPAPFDVLEQFAGLLSPEAQLIGAYGATETLSVAVVGAREVLDETRHASVRGAGVCVGRPVARIRVWILPITDAPLRSAALQSLPAGQVGEITVSGPGVSRAYVGRAEANRLAKVVLDGGEIAHRTGDLGYLDEQGRLWFCGRKSQRVRTRAGDLFTEQIEGIFNAHALVYRSALVGVERDGQTEPVLWVELTGAGRRASRAQIRAELLELAQAHPGARAIRRILFHPAFPTDVRHNSKIIREKLARLARGRR